LFDDVVFSYEVKCAKPNPKIYKIACENINVLPKESIFIGDGGSNELYGATNIGMSAYHATWFQPVSISEKILDYPKLYKPSQITDILRN
jgi:HAD superfamily hydrolase (TIGR01509 family)